MPKIKLKSETGLRAYHSIRNLLPQKELVEEEEKFNKNFGTNMDFHPFVRFLNDAKNDFDIGEKLHSNRITKNLAKLIVLGLDIEFLQKRNISGIDSKINELLTSSYQKSDNIAYEIRIASYLTQLGHNVKFLEESTTPTPDLLINDEIQLDCKNKNPISKSDQLNYEIFNKFAKEILDELLLLKKYYYVYIHFGRVDQIDEKLTSESKNQLIEDIKLGTSTKFSHTNFDVTLYEICKNEYDIINSNLPYIPQQLITKVGIEPLYDRTESIMRQKIGESEFIELLRKGESFFDYRNGYTNLNGMTGISHFCALSGATKKLPEKYTSILDAIRYANKQIHSGYPGVVSIGISDFSSQMFPREMRQASVLSQDELKSNQNISAAIFTKDTFDENTNEYAFGAVMLKNNNAKIELPIKYDNLECF